MSVQLLQQGPPPYVRFEQRAEEDRKETVRQGRLVLRDVDYVVITRAGRKDTSEHIAPEWLAHCEKLSRETPPKWPPEWLAAHKKMYEQWKTGQEVTQPGFPIRQWAAITKAQAENLVMARVLTVEHLAAAEEGVLVSIGLGARELKQRAQAWLEANKDNKGEELASLRADNATLTETVHTQTQKIAELESAIQSMQAQLPTKRRA